MFRTIAIVAAATMIAAPALAQSMRVPVAGKSAEQLHSEIVKAAQKVCAQASYGALAGSTSACVKATVKDALNQVAAPEKVAMR